MSAPLFVSAPLFGEADARLLVRLLETPTVSPFELGGGDPEPRLWEAQCDYATAAGELGFVVEQHRAATPDEVRGDDVPLAVTRAIGERAGFLEAQPSLVLRLGPPVAAVDTVMLNVHLDTVAGFGAVRFDGSRFEGRGAIDAKGPAVALLSGVRAAVAAEPALGTRAGVLIQAVSGEEGGIMGTTGTRRLVAGGFTGRLNVFCEPTALRYLPRATASMTARVSVAGEDATDDRPECGDNATVLLGFLAQHLALALTGDDAEGRVCVAGLTTGALHNRVYGSGALLINMSYAHADAGERMRVRLEAALADGIAAFAERFAADPTFARTAARADAITRLDWLKRGLPVLTGADPWCEALLQDGAGLRRWPDDEPAFTCDAIWMGGLPGAYTVVLGPGDLARNNAHADGEFVDLEDLEAFAGAIARTLVSFARARAAETAGTRARAGLSS